MKIIQMLFLIFISLIKFIDSLCLRLINCEWNDPCKKYFDINECSRHEECTLGVPDDSGFEFHFEYGNGGHSFPEEFSANNGLPHPPLACKKKNFSQCCFNMPCSIFWKILKNNKVY